VARLRAEGVERARVELHLHRRPAAVELAHLGDLADLDAGHLDLGDDPRHLVAGGELGGDGVTPVHRQQDVLLVHEDGAGDEGADQPQHPELELGPPGEPRPGGGQRPADRSEDPPHGAPSGL
jgi:hypothetical protein